MVGAQRSPNGLVQEPDMFTPSGGGCAHVRRVSAPQMLGRTVHPLCPLCLFLQRPDDKRLAKFSDEVATVSTFSPSEWALGLASPSAVSALLSCNKVLVMPILNRRT